MKKSLILFALLFTSISFAQDTILTSKVAENIGKLVFVKGKIASIKLAGDGKTTNYINIDQSYPNNIFTVILTNKYLENHSIKLEDTKGKNIIVKGTIEIYEKDPKKIPQIFNPLEIIIK